MPTPKLTKLPTCPRCSAVVRTLPSEDYTTGEMKCASCGKSFEYTRHVSFSTSPVGSEDETREDDEPVAGAERRSLPEASVAELRAMGHRAGKDGWGLIYELWPDVQKMRESSVCNFHLSEDFATFTIYHTAASLKLRTPLE